MSVSLQPSAPSLGALHTLFLASHSTADEVAAMYPRVLATAAGLVAGRDAREDLVQESIARCWPIVDALEMQRARATAYLRGAIRLIALEHRRTQREEISIDESAELRAPNEDVLDDMIHDEDVRRARAALATLPSCYRDTLEDCFVHEMTCEEIAEMPIRSVRTVQLSSPLPNRRRPRTRRPTEILLN